MSEPMVTAYQFLCSDVRPALAQMKARFWTPAAECMLVAIPAQECNYAHLYQIGDNKQPLPHLARGLYQFEKTGVKLCLAHSANKWLRPFLVAHGWLTPTTDVIHRALPASSSLSVWMARANLFWYPEPLVEPVADFEHEEAAWQQYLATWNPGKPHRATWHRAWYSAVEAVRIPNEKIFTPYMVEEV